MAEAAERQPLLPHDQLRENGHNNESRQAERARRFLIAVLSVLLIVAVLAILVALSGTAVYAILTHSFKNNTCNNLTLSWSDLYIRSGSYSSLIQIPHDTVACYKPSLRAAVSSFSSTVEVLETLCENIDTNPFQVSYELSDITIDGEPIAVFDENFSQRNYFYGEGEISVDIVNLSTNHASVDLVMCLFTSVDEYGDFKRAGTNWKNFTSTAKCNSLTVESGIDYKRTINVTDKSYVFVGMATTDLVHVGALKVSASGQDIADPGGNSTKACQLNGGKRECTFDLQVSSVSEDVCVLAYEDDNPDGTYDYSNITLSLSRKDKNHNRYDMGLHAFGYSLAGLFLLCFVLVILFACVCVWGKRRHEKTSIQESQVDQPAEEGEREEQRRPRVCGINYQN